MLEARGDLWRLAEAEGVDAICVTTNGFRKANGECVMGRGSAGEAKSRWPDLPSRLGKLLGEHGNRCFRLRVEGLKAFLVTFPTKPDKGPEGQPGFRVDSDPDLIRASAEQLKEMADKFGWQRVLVPRPGVGAGRLSWEDVEPLLSAVFDDRFTVVTFVD